MNALSTAGDFLLSNSSVVDDKVFTPNISHWNWSFSSDADLASPIARFFVGERILITFIAFIGIVANALNVVVLSTEKNLKRAPIYEFLLSMTAADLSIAVCNFAYFVIQYKRIILEIEAFEIATMEYFFSFISHWNTTSVAAFRFIAVHFPLRAAQCCTRRLTRVTIACTIIAAFLVNPLLYNLMYFVPLLHFYTYEFDIFANTIGTFLPWTLAVFLVILLLASPPSRTVSGMATVEHRNRLRGEQRQLTATLTLTVAWIVVTTGPHAMFSMFYKEMFEGYSEYSYDEQMLVMRFLSVARIMMMLNYCGNFFIYSWMNKYRRKQLRELMSSCKRR